MKHIKKFNESTEDFKNELKSFCEDHLVYLIDDGLEVDITDIYMLQRFKITLTLPKKSNKNWDDIKDEVIPFISILSNKHTLRLVTIYHGYLFRNFNVYNKEQNYIDSLENFNTTFNIKSIVVEIGEFH